MSLFKCILCFKEIEKDYEWFLVQSKKKTIFDVNLALVNLKFHSVHAASGCICVGSVMVCSKRNNLQQNLEVLQKSMGINCPTTCWKICVKSGWQPTQLLRFVTFVHLLFSFRSLNLFVASLLFMKCTSFCVISSLFQALGQCGWLKKWAGNKAGSGREKERAGDLSFFPTRPHSSPARFFNPPLTESLEKAML